jgi:hypothetical protein
MAHARHGYSYPKTPTYTVWVNIRQRCLNPRSQAFHNYGGRGITICDRWLVFENFLTDMGEKPNDMEIERRDNDADYSPDNCIWATRKANGRNRRTNKLTPELAAAIKAAYVPRIVPQHVIAKRFGVCQMTVSLVVRGETWT